jgi:hypothetical protein
MFSSFEISSQFKAPYCCFVEVVTVDDIHTSNVQSKLCEASTRLTASASSEEYSSQIRSCRSHENLRTLDVVRDYDDGNTIGLPHSITVAGTMLTASNGSNGNNQEVVTWQYDVVVELK